MAAFGLTIGYLYSLTHRISSDMTGSWPAGRTSDRPPPLPLPVCRSWFQSNTIWLGSPRAITRGGHCRGHVPPTFWGGGLYYQNSISFQLQGVRLPWPPDQGLCPWTTLGAPPPDPRSPTIQKKSPPLAITTISLTVLAQRKRVNRHTHNAARSSVQ